MFSWSFDLSIRERKFETAFFMGYKIKSVYDFIKDQFNLFDLPS